MPIPTQQTESYPEAQQRTVLAIHSRGECRLRPRPRTPAQVCSRRTPSVRRDAGDGGATGRSKTGHSLTADQQLRAAQTQTVRRYAATGREKGAARAGRKSAPRGRRRATLLRKTKQPPAKTTPACPRRKELGTRCRKLGPGAACCWGKS